MAAPVAGAPFTHAIGDGPAWRPSRSDQDTSGQPVSEDGILAPARLRPAAEGCGILILWVKSDELTAGKRIRRKQRDLLRRTAEQVPAVEAQRWNAILEEITAALAPTSDAVIVA
jgi:hypothetical protein